MSNMMSKEKSAVSEFEKYMQKGAYHWTKTFDSPVLSKGVRLFARYQIPVRLLKIVGVREGMVGADLGCGDGVMLYALHNGGYKAFGLDGAEEGIRCAKIKLSEHGLHPRLDVGSIYQLPYETGSLDFVTSLEVIEHLDKLDDMLTEVRRVLKKGGVFICTTPQRPSGAEATYVRDPYHVKEFVSDELELQLRSIFDRVEIYGGYQQKLDRLYRPGKRGFSPMLVFRVAFRLLTALSLNPYVFVRKPPSASDDLLVGVAFK